MANLSHFGDFFGFTATVNFATSIFTTFSEFMSSLLSRFEVDKLSKQKVFHEQAMEVFQTTLDIRIRAATGAKLAALEVKKNDGQILILKARNAEISVRYFLNEINNSLAYKTNFERKFMPLFPLAGTYSLIFLFLAPFSEGHGPNDLVCFNTILLVNILMVVLAAGNYLNWFWLRDKSQTLRTLVLNSMLVGGTIISWLLALAIKGNEELQVGELTLAHERNMFIMFLFISGIGFIALLVKMIRINFIAWMKIGAFKRSNKLMRTYLGEFVST